MKKRSLLSILVAMLSILLLGAAREVPTYTIINLGSLGGNYSAAYSINDLGQVVGATETASGEYHAFLWENSVMTDLGTLGGQVSVAYDINNRQQIVGSSYTAGAEDHAFLWENGAWLDLGVPLGGVFSYASAINDWGQIVGSSDSDLSWLWQNGSIIDLGGLGTDGCLAMDISDRGAIVGGSSTALGDWHAFLWRPGANGLMIDLKISRPQYTSEANSINELGQIVGQVNGQAFLWNRKVVTKLGTLGGPGSRATSINNTTQIVGNSQTSSGLWHAFVWDSGVMVDLGTLGEGWQSIAFSINDNGWIVGSSWFGNEGYAVLWIEP